MNQDIHIFQEGGIGDLIISLPLIQHYFNDDDHKINLYTNFPEVASYFLPFVKCGNFLEASRKKNDLEYSISISDMVFLKKKPNVVIPDFLQSIYKIWLGISSNWLDFMNSHPFRANEMAHKATGLGLKRWTLPFHFIGKEWRPYAFYNDVNEINIPKNFITIHDGFDAQNHYKFARSTKSWDVKYWEKFVAIFKRIYPEISVIQLGGVKHHKIKGVDINFAGQISFERSLQYLKSSIVHIDGESGLVHARRLFNRPSVVIFGPTNHEYFGYPENYNLQPSFCGDCWWKKKDWMQNCVKGFEKPRCIDSIEPETVIYAVKNCISNLRPEIGS